jgi:hypothetical protein
MPPALRLRPLLPLLALGLIAGCATKAPGVRETAEYVSAPLRDAELMPEINEERGNVKVIVVPADEGTDRLAREARLGSHLSGAIGQLLGGRGIEVVDENLAAGLGDALRRAELTSTGRNDAYAGPKVANFTVKASISSSNYGASYQAAQSFTDKKGKVTTVPATYNHNANIAATVRVYEMPSLRLVGSVNLKGSTSFSDARTQANVGTGVAMLRKAAENATGANRTELLNLFATKGYVVARRIHSKAKNSVFQVSIGKIDGLKAGDQVDVFSLRPAEKSLLRNAPATEEIFVASGTVAPMLLTDTTAWITLDDDAQAVKVRRGDLVKQKHTKGFLESLNKALQ